MHLHLHGDALDRARAAVRKCKVSGGAVLTDPPDAAIILEAFNDFAEAARLLARALPSSPPFPAHNEQANGATGPALVAIPQRVAQRASDARIAYVSHLRQIATREETDGRETYASLLFDVLEAVEEGRQLDAVTLYHALPLELCQALGAAPPRSV
jgi:hypothetical protein